MTRHTNKIDANDRTIAEILDGKKYAVVYFQREFTWEQSHIEQLITDLTSAFLDEYHEGDSRTNPPGCSLLQRYVTMRDHAGSGG